MGDVDEVERLLRESEELLEALNLLEHARDAYAELFELAPLALFIVSGGPRFLVQGLNVAARELLERQPEDLYGRSFTDLVDVRDRPLVLGCLRSGRALLERAEVRLLGARGLVTVQLAAVASKTELGTLHVSAA